MHRKEEEVREAMNVSDDEFDESSLLYKQKKILLNGKVRSVCVYQCTRILEAASVADDINNDRNPDWDASKFRATYTREKVSRVYEVRVEVRPERFYSLVVKKSKPTKEESAPVPPATPWKMELFYQELGADNVATRAVRSLYRWRQIDSVEKLRSVYQELGAEAFEGEVREIRHVGEATVERIMHYARGES